MKVRDIKRRAKSKYVVMEGQKFLRECRVYVAGCVTHEAAHKVAFNAYTDELVNTLICKQKPTLDEWMKWAGVQE
jgi:hypothetical protein